MKKRGLLQFTVLTFVVALLMFSPTALALDTVVGETEVYLDAARENIRTKETNLGNLIADMFVAVSGADLAITNGGGIREAIEPGPITLEDVLTVLPFENVVVTIELTGAEIWAALEHAIGQYPALWGGFPQVSEQLRFVADADQEPGSRLLEVHYLGEPLDMEAVFIVATNNFLAAGGDDFTMLEKEVIASFGEMQEVLIQYLQENSPVAPVVEGRITITGGETEE